MSDVHHAERFHLTGVEAYDAVWPEGNDEHDA